MLYFLLFVTYFELFEHKGTFSDPLSAVFFKIKISNQVSPLSFLYDAAFFKTKFKINGTSNTGSLDLLTFNVGQEMWI